MNFESTLRKNKFIQKYDYGRDIVGFDEYVLRLASSCPLNCSYCYLQDINKKSQPKVYTNLEALRKEIIELRQNVKGKIYLNAGENADSLVFEPEAGLIKFLDGTISDLTDIQIELRTKTNNVDFLKTLKNKDKFNVVFTLSPENVVERLEKNTASLAKRIEAAGKCQEFGINVGLRFEPIINSKTLTEDYEKTIDLIKKRLNSERIQSFGLSCLRFTKGLMKKLESNAPELLLDEFVVCPDGKYRYFRPIRTRIYIQIINMLKEQLPNVKLFLSTEPAYIWKDCGLFPLHESF